MLTGNAKQMQHVSFNGASKALEMALIVSSTQKKLNMIKMVMVINLFC